MNYQNPAFHQCIDIMLEPQDMQRMAAALQKVSATGDHAELSINDHRICIKDKSKTVLTWCKPCPVLKWAPPHKVFLNISGLQFFNGESFMTGTVGRWQDRFVMETPHGMFPITHHDAQLATKSIGMSGVEFKPAPCTINTVFFS
jgi:hypothetical protein